MMPNLLSGSFSFLHRILAVGEPIPLAGAGNSRPTIKVNVNLPDPHFRIHGDPWCPYHRDAGKRGTRVVRIDPSNLAERLGQLRDGPYRFLAQKGFNAMWIEFDFPDEGSAMAAIGQTKQVLDSKHLPFQRAHIEPHCPATP